MISSGAAEAAGGMSALKAAFSAANTGSSGTGGEMLAAASDMAVGDADSGSETSGISGETPFAKAAGFSSDISGGSAASVSPDTQGDQTPGNRSSDSRGGFLSNLAQGTADVAKAKVSSVVESAKERIADTTGGRIADAIQARAADSDSSSVGNSLGSADETEVDMAAEIAAFVGTDTKQS
jgi:type IV secretion system protein TrbL